MSEIQVMNDSIMIGSTPCNEECEQLGPGYNEAKARAECEQFRTAIRRELGEEPDGAKLSIVSNPHQFGTYYTVDCKYTTQEGLAYAMACEADCPTEWSPEDISALAEKGFSATSTDEAEEEEDDDDEEDEDFEDDEDDDDLDDDDADLVDDDEFEDDED